MAASYTLDTMPDRNRIDMKLSGFWLHKDAERFAVDLTPR